MSCSTTAHYVHDEIAIRAGFAGVNDDLCTVRVGDVTLLLSPGQCAALAVIAAEEASRCTEFLEREKVAA